MNERVIEADVLEVLRFCLDAGGPRADIIASAPDEVIEELIKEVEKIRIIL